MDPIVNMVLTVLIGMATILFIVFLPDMKKAIHNHRHNKVVEQWKKVARCLKSTDPNDPSALRSVIRHDACTIMDDEMIIYENENNTYIFAITTVDGYVISGTVNAKILERMTLMPVSNYIHRNIDSLPDIF